MDKTVIVGIGHRARHGKDTVGRMIHEAFPADTKVYSFAAALRAVCRTILRMEEKDGPLLQLVGTEVFRLAPNTPERENPIAEFITRLEEAGNFSQATRLAELSSMVGGDPDVWVRSVKHLIAEDAPRIAIITDMRFPNEVAITDATIKVTRLLADGKPFVAPDRPADHPSEIALDSYDGWSAQISARDGDLKGLRKAALSAFNNLMIERGILL